MSVSRITESVVIQAPLAQVWAALRPATFDFWSAVKSSSVEGSVDQGKNLNRSSHEITLCSRFSENYYFQGRDCSKVSCRRAFWFVALSD